MPFRHAVLLALPSDCNRPIWSYRYTGTLPRLISFVCHSYANTGGVGVFFPFWNLLVSCRGFAPSIECLSKPSTHSRQLGHCHSFFKSFRCNTYGSPRNCCKQRTYVLTKSFRCNTYKKPRGEGALRRLDFSTFRYAGCIPDAVVGRADLPTRLRSLPFRPWAVL